MAQQYATDEAGNVWEVDAAGNAVRFVSGAQGGGSAVVAPNPIQAAKAQYDVPQAQIDLARAQQQYQTTAATAPYDARAAAAAATKAELEVQKTQRELAAPPKNEQQDRITSLRTLANQVIRTRQLFNQGPGQTSGLSGVLDYLPTDANARFDVAGAQLSQQGLATFRVPGTGTVSDRDAMMFDRGNLPTASTRDAAVEEQLRSVMARIDEEMRALGQPAINWAGQGQTEQRQDQPAAVGGANQAAPPSNPPQGPRGYDVSSVGGGPGAPNAGGGFTNAAGLMMARKLSDAYNKGADLNQLNTLLMNNGFPAFSDPEQIARINKRGPITFMPPQADDSRGAMGKLIGEAVDNPVGAYAAGAANALTMGGLDEIAGGQAQLAKEYGQQQYPGATIAGNVTGGALAMLPLERAMQAIGIAGQGAKAALLSDGLYGAAYGAGENNDNRLAGAATGALSAAAGNVVGTKAAQVAGKLVSGVSDPAVRYLASRNIPMSMGQLVGNRGLGGKLINKLESTPVLGDMLGARRLDSMSAFNREAINDALAPIGATAKGEMGQAAIGNAQDAVSDAYTNALSGVQVRADRPFVRDMRQALRAGASVPVEGPKFEHLMDAKLRPLFQGRTLDGRGAQAALQTVRKARGSFASEGAMGDLVNDQLGAIDTSVNDLLMRQAPAAAQGLSDANQAFANLAPIQAAATTAVNGAAGAGIFTPAQLTRAVAQNTVKYGGKGAAARGAKQTPLMTAAQEVLPSTVPNSGTTDRLAALALPAVLGGGAYGLSDVSPQGAAGLGLLAAATSRPGSRLLQKALTSRSAGAQRIGSAIQQRARLGGLFGAPLLVDLTN